MIKIENIQMDDDYYSLILEYLNNKTGLNFEYYRRNFVERRLKARMIRVKCNSLHFYYYYLKENPLEIQNFLENFNINYSCFFRYWKVFLQLENFFLSYLKCKREDLLTNLKSKSKDRIKKRKIITSNASEKVIERNRKLTIFKSKNPTNFSKESSLYRKINNASNLKKAINVWSCPCASREEPYSIAIILDNLKKQIPKFPRFRIIASDIDVDAINKALVGFYNENTMQEISKFNEKNYFIRTKGRFGNIYLINDDFKNYVEFIEEDIMNGHNKAIKYDIILCRYLLIYISRETRDKLLKIIENQLESGGLLILGKTETLLNSYSNLKLIDSRNHIYLKIK